MKRILLFSYFIGFTVVLLSCRTDMFNGGGTCTPQKATPDLTTWQGQVEYAKNPNRLKSRTTVDDIRLVGYKQKGSIVSKEEVPDVINRIFSEDSYIVRYVDLENFEIVPIGLLIKEAKAVGFEGDPLANIKSELLPLLRVGAGRIELELIELEWNFKGGTYYSLAVATNEYGGIIYDNIGHLIVADKPDFGSVATRSGVPMLKRSETGDKDKGDGGDDGDKGDGGSSGGGEPAGGGGSSESIHLYFDRTNTYNILGLEVAHYSVYCRTSFKDGVISDMSMEATHAHMPGFSSAAQIVTLSGGELGDAYHKFSYAYGVGTGSFTISNGSEGLTISGGSGGTSGVEIHQIKI